MLRLGSRDSFAFQAIQKLYAHFTNLCFSVICKFLGDFWGFLGRDSFSQRISEIWRNKKYGRFDLFLKLEFEVKN